ncbi:MAG: elongation factor P [Anaerolineae bacterium SM23_84]|nr:MAG: elongation factor P [Anaerolineae bacterium SM23_84]
MIGVQELRKGVTFELDGQIYRVLEYQHHKPGRGAATIRTKLRNLRTGATIDRNFISGDRVQDIRLDHRTVQYLYRDGNLYYFMDVDTYEQPAISAELLGSAAQYLKEGTTIDVLFYEGQPLDIELPVTVELEVTETEPGVKGDTATGATKAATLETGLVVQVPLFVDVGDVLRVDTRTGQYLTRV